MRLARKAAMLGIAVTALAAPAAVAQIEPLTHKQNPQIVVQTETHGATDANCFAVTPSPAPVPSPTVTAGGCRSHISGSNIQLFTHTSGIEVLVSSFDIEFDVRIDAAGEGYMSHQELSNFSGFARRACGQDFPSGEGRAYSFFMREVEPAPTEEATMLLCTEDLGGNGPWHCEFTLPVGEPTPHAYRFTAVEASGHGTDPGCELNSTSGAVFNTEAALQATGESQSEQRLEIRHQ